MYNKRFLMALLVYISLVTSVKGAANISVSTGTISINMSAINAAGIHINEVVNSSQTIKYSYSSNYYYGKITASIASGTVPGGMSVTLDAADASWWFLDGISSGETILSTTPKSIIYNINNTYRTVNRRVYLIVRITDFAQVHPGTYPITILYTISAQ